MIKRKWQAFAGAHCPGHDNELRGVMPLSLVVQSSPPPALLAVQNIVNRVCGYDMMEDKESKSLTNLFLGSVHGWSVCYFGLSGYHQAQRPEGHHLAQLVSGRIM